MIFPLGKQKRIIIIITIIPQINSKKLNKQKQEEEKNHIYLRNEIEKGVAWPTR